MYNAQIVQQKFRICRERTENVQNVQEKDCKVQQSAECGEKVQQGAECAGKVQQGAECAGKVQQGAEYPGKVQQGADIRNIFTNVRIFQRRIDVKIFLRFSTLFRHRNFDAILTFNRKCQLGMVKSSIITPVVKSSIIKLVAVTAEKFER